MSNIITVKVIRVPGTVSEVGLEEGATVADALAAAGATVSSNEGVTVNGNAATSDMVLPDGARVIIAKGAKSN